MSIKQIAELTQSSPATVSRVLNNPSYKCQTPGLRERIWKTAMELNYTPNEAARNLKKAGSTAKPVHYGIDILMTRMDGMHADPFFEELLRVVESQIHDHACILSGIWYKSIFSDERRCEHENLDAVFKEMFPAEREQQDGLIIIGKCCSKAIQKLKKYYRNMVTINRNPTGYELDEVLCDGRKIAAMAVEYLTKLEHTKIAYVGKCHGEARYRGYSEVLRKHELDFYPEYVVETEQTEKEGFAAMEKFLKLDDPPTAIYCANDITAVGMLKCLNQYRSLIYTPSIIASDDIEEGEFTRPMLSTVHLPKENMAKFAMYLLLDRIRGGHTEVVRIELEGKLKIRSSCSMVSEVNQPEYCI